MAHTYTCLHYHCVFATLGRRNLIFSDLQPRLHAYIGGIVKNIKGFPVAVGGDADHVHVLLALPADKTVASAVRDIKANSSRWIHETTPLLENFAWQEGYGAFAVSRSGLDQAADYVRRQGEHHKAITFQQEFLALLKKHQIPYDEHFVWD